MASLSFEDYRKTVLEMDSFDWAAFAEGCLALRASDIYFTEDGCFLRIAGEPRQFLARSEFKARGWDLDTLLLDLSPIGEHAHKMDRKKPDPATGTAVNFACLAGQIRMRVNLFHSYHRGNPEDPQMANMRAISAAMRPLPAAIPSPAELGLPADLVRRLTSLRSGLVLVSGPASSGKTSTVVSLVQAINAARSCHILTIEDPIEYVITPAKAIVNQRQIGRHCESFAAGAHDAQRQASDVLFIGEILDYETLRTVLVAAEAGMLVITTTHARDTVSVIARLVAMAPAGEDRLVRAMLASAIRASVCQLLVPNRAMSQRVPVRELFFPSPAALEMIRTGKESKLADAISTGSKEGMILFSQALQALVSAGTISQTTADSHIR